MTSRGVVVGANQLDHSGIDARRPTKYLFKPYPMQETNVRLSVPEETHKKVLKIQGIFAFKEGKKTTIHDVYTRLIERGASEIMKQNK